MAWFKTDDALHSHPKARKAGLEAMGMWVLAGSHAMQYLTDGFVPSWYVESWPHGRRCANALVRAGLWIAAENDGETGWRFKDWEHYQPTRTEIEADREQARDRQRKFRQARREAKNKAQDKSTEKAIAAMRNGVTDGATNAETNDPPLPTRPDPALSLGDSQVGGGGHLSSADIDPTAPDFEPWRCDQHQGMDVKCWNCAEAKKNHRARQGAEQAEAKDSKAASDRAAIRAAQAKRRAEDEAARAEAEADPERVAEAKARALAAVKEAS